MRRTTAAVLAFLLVATALVAVPTAMAQQTDTNQTSNQTSNESISPGAQLSGVVGVQEAELNGDVESRAYGISIAGANSNDSRAAVVAGQINATEQRLDELEAERDELEEARENGSISEGEYRARAATLHAESQTVQRLANQSNETASGLPAETLEANGVNVSAIRTISDRAANLTGPEVADIARSIAGPNAGMGVGPGANVTDRPGNAGGNAGGSVEFGTPEETNTTATNETATDASETAPADN